MSAKAAPTSFRIRPARQGDIEELAALEEALFTTDRVKLRQFRYHIVNPRAFLRICVAPDGAIVGYVLVTYRKTYARLYSIAIHPDAQGHGLGARLLAAALRDAKARGATKMGLEVRTMNFPAIALYEKNGFEKIRFLPGYYEDKMDGIQMLKWLVPPV